MRQIIGWLGALVIGYVGWWLGQRVGFATGILLSAVGSGVGLYLGYRWFDDNLK